MAERGSVPQRKIVHGLVLERIEAICEEDLESIE
jgi:hypothetical protein